GGKEMDFKYKDCKKEMDMVNKAFIETMIEGDSHGRGFQYPIPTYSITRDFDWSDTENNRLLFEMTSKYGTPYFSNYINSDMAPSDVRSMCCRLRLDLRELRKKTGGFFGSGESTGSVGVVTINMPRIAYLAANKAEFYARLDRMMDIAARSLKIKRGVISKLLDEGLYPYTKRYLGSFDNHFSTIGLIGMNEVGLNANWLRADMSDPRTQEFTKEVLNHMRNRLSDYQEQYGDLYNLEATPAESTTYRLAKHDKKRYPMIKTAGKEGDTPYYTNSSHLPVDYTVDIFDALDIQDDLQTLYTSGTVFHAFLGEKLPDWKAAANLVRTIAENYKLPYYTMSPTYSICKEHGYLAGEVKICPHCGAKTEVYSRITGYYRPVQNWNDGKLQEYANRTEYDIAKSELKRPVSSVVTLSNFDKDVEVNVEKPEGVRYLFTTKTCPNCALAKSYLEGIPYVVIDAMENVELATRYGVMQAPTLVEVNGDDFTKYVGAPKILKYAQQLKLATV
ncbi:MAG: ribonucleoside triphosphate reductase, partial [Lachnospiraceae bacterium]|nr:ribonucleoside triphosphate reductase [Lachnospiraceae bacterium]